MRVAIPCAQCVRVCVNVRACIVRACFMRRCVRSNACVCVQLRIEMQISCVRVVCACVPCMRAFEVRACHAMHVCMHACACIA